MICKQGLVFLSKVAVGVKKYELIFIHLLD